MQRSALRSAPSYGRDGQFVRSTAVKAPSTSEPNEKEKPELQWSTALSDAALSASGVLLFVELARHAYSLPSSPSMHCEASAPTELNAHQRSVVLRLVLAVQLIAAAAGLGAMRFAGLRAFRPMHEFASELAGRVGVPLLALAFAALFLPVHFDAFACFPDVMAPLSTRLPAGTHFLLDSALLLLLLVAMLSSAMDLRLLGKIPTLLAAVCLLSTALYALSTVSTLPEASLRLRLSAAAVGLLLGTVLMLASGAVGTSFYKRVRLGFAELICVDAFHYLLAVANLCFLLAVRLLLRPLPGQH